MTLCQVALSVFPLHFCVLLPLFILCYCSVHTEVGTCRHLVNVPIYVSTSFGGGWRVSHNLHSPRSELLAVVLFLKCNVSLCVNTCRYLFMYICECGLQA